MSGLMLAVGIVLVVAAVGILLSWGFTHLIARKVGRAMPPHGKMQDVEGGRIHYVESGSGRSILRVHGLSGNLYNLTYATFDRLSDQYHVLAIDRPGCGYSQRDGDEQARLPEQARMIAEFIDHRGLDKPLVVGHSLGGAVALRLALEHPDRVGGLVLLAPLAAVQTEVPSVFNGLDIEASLVRRVISETLAVPLSIRNGAKVVSAIFAPNPVPEDFRTRGGGLLSLRPGAFYAASTDMRAITLDLESQVARYGDISCPVGVLFGDDDGVLDPDTHLGAFDHNQSDIQRIAGQGHMIPITAPDETDAFIRRIAGQVF